MTYTNSDSGGSLGSNPGYPGSLSWCSEWSFQVCSTSLQNTASCLPPHGVSESLLHVACHCRNSASKEGAMRSPWVQSRKATRTFKALSWATSLCSSCSFIFLNHHGVQLSLKGGTNSTSWLSLPLHGASLWFQQSLVTECPTVHINQILPGVSTDTTGYESVPSGPCNCHTLSQAPATTGESPKLSTCHSSPLWIWAPPTYPGFITH